MIGRRDVMDVYGPGEMTSTHTANPVCCAATLANLQAIEDEDAVGNAARLGVILADAWCVPIEACRSNGRIGHAASVGLVGGAALSS